MDLGCTRASVNRMHVRHKRLACLFCLVFGLQCLSNNTFIHTRIRGLDLYLSACLSGVLCVRVSAYLCSGLVRAQVGVPCVSVCARQFLTPVLTKMCKSCAYNIRIYPCGFAHSTGTFVYFCLIGSLPCVICWCEQTNALRCVLFWTF